MGVKLKLRLEAELERGDLATNQTAVVDALISLADQIMRGEPADGAMFDVPRGKAAYLVTVT